MTRAGDLELVNQQTLDYFGMTLEELKRSGIVCTIHPDDHADVRAAAMKGVETGAPYSIEARFRRSDGVYRWFSASGFPLLDEEGRIVLWYFLQTDVDDRRRAEDLLAGEKQLLEMVALGRPLPLIL